MLLGQFTCNLCLSSDLLIRVLLHLQEGPLLKSKGRASCCTKIAILTWRSLLIMSREWKYYWLRLIIYMFLALCIGTVFSGLGHSLSSVVVSCNIPANSSICSILIENGCDTMFYVVLMCFFCIAD